MTTYRVEQIKGRWNVVRYQGQTRQKRVIGGGSEAKRQAELIAAELTAKDVRTGLGLSPAVLTFKDYAEKWYQDIVVPHKRAGTAHGYRSILDLHLIPLVGLLPLGEITREHLRVLARKPLARNSVRNILATLRTILNEALEDGYISKNPASKLKRFMPSNYDPRAAMQALEEEQVGRLLKAAEKHLPDHALMIRLLFYTGVRQGEAFGLQWGDIDFTRKVVHVRRSIDHRRGRTIVNLPKSGKGRWVGALGGPSYVPS